MVETLTARRLLGRALYVVAALFLAFLMLLPLSGGAGRLPGPDLFVLLTFSWVLRRPDYVPTLLVASVMLVADFVFLRPPGLWAAMTVLGLEFLRTREAGSRDLPFLVEWSMVGVVLTAMTLASVFVLVLFMVPQPPLGLTLIQLILTIAAYPAAVALTVFAFGFRRPAHGAVDELGHRL